jgi:hypothetical protein
MTAKAKDKVKEINSKLDTIRQASDDGILEEVIGSDDILALNNTVSKIDKYKKERIAKKSGFKLINHVPVKNSLEEEYKQIKKHVNEALKYDKGYFDILDGMVRVTYSIYWEDIYAFLEDVNISVKVMNKETRFLAMLLEDLHSADIEEKLDLVELAPLQKLMNAKQKKIDACIKKTDRFAEKVVKAAKEGEYDEEFFAEDVAYSLFFRF